MAWPKVGNEIGQRPRLPARAALQGPTTRFVLVAPGDRRSRTGKRGLDRRTGLLSAALDGLHRSASSVTVGNKRQFCRRRARQPTMSSHRLKWKAVQLTAIPNNEIKTPYHLPVAERGAMFDVSGQKCSKQLGYDVSASITDADSKIDNCTGEEELLGPVIHGDVKFCFLGSN